MGYRDGKRVFIVGEQILASWDCKYMFAGHDNYGDLLWDSLVNIDGLELIDTSQAKDMKLMFAFSKVKKLSGIGGWNVSRVQDFSAMFQGHSNSGDAPFTYLDVANWDTSSALSMSHMFYGCAQLTSIPIDNWNVSKVGSFSHMFADCYNLKSLNFSNWETTNVVSFDAFLNDCRSLVQIDVSALDTSTCKQFS
jgi:surface protein